MDKNLNSLNNDSLSLLRIVTIKLKLKADESIKSLGISSIQGRVLGFIAYNQGGNLIQKDIAKHFDKKNATITSMLQSLEKKGLIERSIPKDNERQKNIYLTEKGAEVISSSRDVFLNLNNEFKNILDDDEIKTLNKLLSKLNDAL